MEEKKPNMPPPPKMPPPPPRPNATPKQSAPQQPAPQAQETTATQAKQEESVEIPVQEEGAKETKTKEKKKFNPQTLLYWGGFVLCLVGIGLCIFFLVR